MVGVVVLRSGSSPGVVALEAIKGNKYIKGDIREKTFLSKASQHETTDVKSLP